MKELINVKNENGEQLVSARELHAFLECTERFSNWFERQLQFGFEENIDFIGCKVFNTQANQELQEYILKIDMAKEISMLQKSEKGKQARRYFIECEKRLIRTPQTYIESLERLLASEKEKERLRLALEKQTDETERKVKAIEVLTGKYDVKILQLIARDYINFQVKRTGRSHQDCWSTIYKLTANALEIDLEAQLNVFKQKQKNIVKNNQQLNRQYQLKGIDAKRPNTLEDSLFGITKLSFICSVLNRADVLLEVMAKVFETDLAELIQKYQFIEQEQRLSQLILD